MPSRSTNLHLTPVVLGHQGGWDEFLLIAIPVVFIGGLLALANRRVNQRLAAVDPADASDPSTSRSAESDPSSTDS